jgi:hypothetical protein
VDFSRSVLGYVSEAFENRDNFAVARSSKDDPEQERNAAEHLVANGAKGLLVWPTNDDPNGEYFTRLAKRVPVVLVDRLLRKANLPAVILDYRAAGREICEHLLGTLGKKRLLVLMDNLRISAYEDSILGVRQAVTEMNRTTDITIVQYPMREIIEPVTQADFSQVDVYESHVRRLLQEGGYDAVFCNQGVFIDRVMVETGLTEEFPHVQLATLCFRGFHTGSRKFCQIGPLQWDGDPCEMVSIAADMLQSWVFSRQAPKDVVRLKLKRLGRKPSKRRTPPMYSSGGPQ